MNGPENFWEGLAAAGSVASVIGLLIAGLAERRARAAERRAASAEAKVDAAVRRTRRVLLLSELAAATEAGRACLRERVSRPAWAGDFQRSRSAVVRLESSGVLSPAERVLVRQTTRTFDRIVFRDDESDRTLRQVVDRLDRVHGLIINALAAPTDD